MYKCEILNVKVKDKISFFIKLHKSNVIRLERLKAGISNQSQNEDSVI